MNRLLCVLALGVLASCGPMPGSASSGGNGGEFALLPGRPTKGEVFMFYQPTGKSRWRSNWTSKLDLTGVSWNDPRTATLISRSHVVMAAHFIRPGNVPVMFHDKRGNPHERFITAVRPLRGVADVAVGKLNLPLPSEISHYRFATEAQAEPGRAVIISDQTRALSIHQIDRVFGKGIRFRFHPDLDPVYQRRLIAGDSGSPSFLLVKGELLLLETHTTGGPGAGPFYGSAEIQSAIRAAIHEMGG